MYVDTRSPKLNITPHCLLYLNMPMQNEFRILLCFCHFEQTDALALLRNNTNMSEHKSVVEGHFKNTFSECSLKNTQRSHWEPVFSIGLDEHHKG